MVAVVVVAQASYLGVLASRLYFIWGDDSDFLLQRGTVPGTNEGLLAPHDDHWSTGVIVIYRVLFYFFGMRTYVPYGLVPILLHSILAGLVFVLLRKAGSGSWIASAGAVVVACAGVGAGAVLWSTTMGLIGAILCGFLAVYILLRTPGAAGVRRCWVVLAIGLTFSGAGITSVCFATVFAYRHLGWRCGLRVFSVPTALFLFWYAVWGHVGAKEPLEDASGYLQVPQNVWDGLTQPFSRATTLAEGGAILLVLIVAVPLVNRGLPKALRDVALSGLVAAIFQLTLAALSRPTFGFLSDFGSGRYAYLTVVLLAPCLAATLLATARAVSLPRYLMAGIAVIVLAGYVLQGEVLFYRDYEVRRDMTEPWPGRLRGIVASAYAGEAVLTRDPVEWYNARFRPDLVAHPSTWDEIPQGNVSPAERLDAERLFNVSVADEAVGLPSPGSQVDLHGFRPPSSTESGCHTYTATTEFPSLVVLTEQGVEFAVSGPYSTVSTHLIRGSDTSDVRAWPMSGEETHMVATTARDAQLVVIFDKPGDYYICT